MSVLELTVKGRPAKIGRRDAESRRRTWREEHPREFNVLHHNATFFGAVSNNCYELQGVIHSALHFSPVLRVRLRAPCFRSQFSNRSN